MRDQKMCGTCKHWELVPQGCSSFWGKCNYPVDESMLPIALKFQDVHYDEGENCPCWETKEVSSDSAI